MKMQQILNALLIALLYSVAAFALDGIALTSSYTNNAYRLDNFGDINCAPIWRLDIVNNQVVRKVLMVADSSERERISPDGTKMVYSRRGKICMMSINGGPVTVLATYKNVPTASGAPNMGPGLDFSNNEWLYYTAGTMVSDNCMTGMDSSGVIRRVNINTGLSEHVITLHPEGNPGLVAKIGGQDIEVDIAMTKICVHVPMSIEPKLLPNSGYAMYYFAAGDGMLSNDKAIEGSSCGGGMSCDGNWVWDGFSGHEGYDIRPADTLKGRIEKTVRPTNGHSPNAGTSTNHPDWICRIIGDAHEDSLRQCFYNWRTGEQMVTGKGDHGDLWVGTSSTSPAMLVSPSTLAFNVQKGAANPTSKSVVISNSGSGTLNSVTTAIAYGTGTPTGWLTVAVTGGATNSQTLTNSISTGTRDIGTYTATVTVTCGNATPSTSSYVVSLRIDPVPYSIGSVTVSPAICTTYTNSSYLFSAVARDAANQVVNPQPTFAWTVSNAQIIGATNGNFLSGKVAGGPYSVIVSATESGVTKSDTAFVRVVRPVTITAPGATPIRKVGDTLSIVWTKGASIVSGGLLVSFSSGPSYTNFQLISEATIAGATIDNGLIMDNSVFYSGTTATFKWIIPRFVGDAGTMSTVSTTCKIRVEDPYAETERKIIDESAVFTIQASNAIAGAGAVLRDAKYRAQPVSIYTINGKLVATVTPQQYAVLTNRILSPGVYLVRFGEKGFTQTHSIMVK